jgi:hypothetical protein
MARWARWLCVAVSCFGAGALGCKATAEQAFTKPSDGGPETPDVVVPSGGRGATPGDVPAATPHVLLSIEPSHGAFSGGTRTILRGNGFGSDVRVWFGSVEVPESDVVAVDAKRIQVTTPAGEAGLVTVVAQNGDDRSTRVELTDGFAYDAFRAEPSSGPTSGGTLITVHGQGTSFDEDTEVSIDREPCEIETVVSATELVCRTPAGTPGAKALRVTSGDGVSVDVLDAFTYGNSDNGFRGGLSGNPLDGNLKVLVLNSVTGDALPGAWVILGEDEPRAERVGREGVVQLTGDDVGNQATVTVAMSCFQPQTLVDIPVDTLTVYLDPVLSPDCFEGSGDLPSGGGIFSSPSSISGELIWPESDEFSRTGWTNVPAPASEQEVKVAYVFQLSADPTSRFRLPSGVSAVTPVATGSAGFTFYLTAAPGNYTLYALAGIENRAVTPWSFTAFSMGLLRGVAVLANSVADDVFIPVDVPLDHALELDVHGPQPTAHGPDRIEATLAVRVGNEGYVILPNGNRSAALGNDRSVSFVGIPSLVGSLSGFSYVVGARAVTGDGGGLPRSVVALASTTTTSEALPIGPFLEIPVLDTPRRNSAWNARDLDWSAAPGGADPDLVIVDITTSGDLFNWRIVAPGNRTGVRLPDLAAVDPELAWPRGAQTFLLSRAQIQNFDYGSLVYRNLTERSWSASAQDTFFASY